MEHIRIDNYFIDKLCFPNCLWCLLSWARPFSAPVSMDVWWIWLKAHLFMSSEMPRWRQDPTTNWPQTILALTASVLTEIIRYMKRTHELMSGHPKHTRSSRCIRKRTPTMDLWSEGADVFVCVAGWLASHFRKQTSLRARLRTVPFGREGARWVNERMNEMINYIVNQPTN